MTDAPLYFETHLGMLRPSNRVAAEAMQHIAGRVTVKITGGKANQRRRSLYWVLAGIVTPLLNDKYAMTLDENDLHDIMRDKLKMFDQYLLPSGEFYKKYWSTSNRAMNEAQRTEYLERCLAIWSTWTGIDVTTLRNEGETA